MVDRTTPESSPARDAVMSSGVGNTEVVAGQFRVIRALGSGAHGTVDLAEDLLNGGRRVALKRLEGIVGAGDPEPVADVLRWFLHPRWAEILDEGRLNAHGRFQVLRYVAGSGLDRVDVPRPAEEVFRFLEDGARVLRGLHRLGVIHYDVTPGNFIREETPDGVTFTLTDGGLANLGPVRGIARGTPMFMAPEVIEGAPHDHRADLYALGLVAFRLATGSDPFRGGAGEVLGRRRREDAPLARTVRADLPEDLERILAALLQRDPANRPGHADELLGLLALVGRTGADRLGLEEATAFAAGGPLVGRTGVVERFRSACRGITSASPARTPGEEFFLTERPTDLPDLVLVLHGPAGTGCTRVMRELASVARAEDVRVLSLSGRAGAADRRSPIRRLSESLALLAPDGDPYLVAATQHRGEAEGVDAVDARAMERFVELCERVAGQRPVVLFIEDFAELPRSSQEALRVLARHLQTRAEHPDGRRLPRLLLVLDHGADDPSDLLIPDARDPRRPCVAVSAFDESETEAFLAARLDPRRVQRSGDAPADDVAYRPLPGDVATLQRATDGLPRLLAGAMAEALVRGDLRSELGHWVWDTGPVSGYELRRTLSLAALRAMETAGPAVHDAAVSLALFDCAIPAEVLAAVVGQDAVSALLRTPLAIVSQEGANVRIAPAGRAVRDALRSRPPEEIDRHRRRLLGELDLSPGSELAADHARLLLEAGRPQDAFLRLTRDEVAPRSLTGRTLRVLAKILAADPRLLATASARSATARRLTAVPEATRVADALFAAMPERLLPGDLEAASLLAASDYAARRYDRVQTLAVRAEGLAVRGPEARSLAHLRVNHARAVLALRPDAAAPLLRAAALSLRRLGRAERASALELRAEYDLASARWRMTRGRFPQAISLHTRLLQRARRASAMTLMAQGYTNIAVALQSDARHELAEHAASRAVRIRQFLGDYAGAAGTLHNLARLKELRGRVREATALYQRVVALGCRLAHYEGAALALTRLASIYENERNPRLAITALLRARQLSGLKRNAPAFAAASRSAAVLLTLTGDIQRGRVLLAESCRAARARNRDEARFAHLEALAARDFLLGNYDGAFAALHAVLTGRGVVANTGVLLGLRAIARLRRRAHFGRSPTALPRPSRVSGFDTLRAELAQVLRLARTGADSALVRVMEILSSSGTSPTPGTAASIHSEVILAAARYNLLNRADARLLLNQVARVAAQQGFSLLQARALALRASSSLMEGNLPGASQDVSAALACLSSRSPVGILSDPRFALPTEFHALLDQLRPHYGIPGGIATKISPAWTELHAAAHVLSLQSGTTSQPDTRMQTALRTILSVSARLKTRSGFEALLESLNRYAREITRAEHTCVVLVSQEGQGEIRIASASSAIVGQEVSRASHTIINRVLRSRTALLLHDVFGDSELMERPSITALGLRSIMCVPMVRGDQVYGAMYADSSAGAGSFDKVDLEILSLFAEQAAAAVETSRLLVDVQRSYAELKATQERLIRGERLRVMGEMTSGVAHEFNNLLTAILARIQLLSLEHLAPAVRESLQLMEKATLDAAGVVRRLQGFTRAQRQADYTEVDLADVCADVVELLRPLWATRRRSGRPGIAVRLRSQPRLCVRGDATELREVVTNLLKNALDALDRGGAITVTAEGRAGRIRVEVRDDGPGIASDLQARLFTPFFTTKGDRGTGLGLCLSQQIVERHGGDIRITSEAGQGTCAAFELPQADLQSTLVRASPRPQEEAKPYVVVVDDDPNVLGPLCGYLERSGYEVRGAGSAAEALSLAGMRPPAAVISDISMPGIDGLELCRRLQRVQPGVPIILMTGQTSDTDPVQVARVGAAALLPKPFTMRQVLELLATVARTSST
jgi:signal transduction histidine kinase/tetratricopeptide (TPR) repeat protein